MQRTSTLRLSYDNLRLIYRAMYAQMDALNLRLKEGSITERQWQEEWDELITLKHRVRAAYWRIEDKHAGDVVSGLA